MRRPHNRLTPGQVERLAKLAEECGEVVQAVGKVLRFGYDSKPPFGGMTGREKLEEELADVRNAVHLLELSRDVSVTRVANRQAVKARRVARFMHHQGDPK